jgi:3-oxoacyl-[acyl-carrier-protein] synthase II
MDRRVVITGLGAITPIGNNVCELWDGIKEGKCGIDDITLFDTSNSKVKIAAEVKNFNPEEHFDRRNVKRLDRFSHFAIVAAREAMKDSGLDVEKIDKTRFGVAISSGIGGLKTIEDNNETLNEKAPDRVSPMFIPMATINMATGNVSIEMGAQGESFSMVTACATGTHTIGECYRIIKHGYQDVMLVRRN